MKIQYGVILSVTFSFFGLDGMIRVVGPIMALSTLVGDCNDKNSVKEYCSIQVWRSISPAPYNGQKRVDESVRLSDPIKVRSQLISKKMDEFCFSKKLFNHRRWLIDLVNPWLPTDWQCADFAYEPTTAELIETLDCLELVAKNNLSGQKFSSAFINSIREHNSYFDALIKKIITQKTNWQQLKGSTVDEIFGWSKAGIRNGSFALYIHQKVMQAFKTKYPDSRYVSTVRYIFSIALQNSLTSSHREFELGQLIASPMLKKTKELRDFKNIAKEVLKMIREARNKETKSTK